VPLLVWAGILALLPAALVLDSVPLLRLAARPALLGLRFLLTGLLAALIIQRDPLVGTTAFWLTRPITRTTLLVSKLVSLATVLVVVPWVVVLIVWWSMGAVAADVLRAATAVAIEQGVVTLLAAMAACITSSLTHFVVAVVAGVALVGAAGGSVQPLVLRFWPFLVGRGWQPDVFVATLFVLGLPIIVYQYIRRRERRSAAMVMVALLAAIGAGLAWPAEPLTRPSRPVNQAVVKPEDIVVSIDRETLIEQYWPAGADGVVVPRTRISAVVIADTRSDAVVLMATAIDSRLTFSDQTVSDRVTAPIGRVLVPRSSARKDLFQLFQRARQSALGTSAVLDSPAVAAVPVGRIAVATVPADVAERHKGEPVILNATVTLQAHQYRVRGVIVARPGARFAFPGSAVEIASVSLSPDSASIGFRQAEIRSTFFEPTVSVQYCLRNAAKHEAFMLESGRWLFLPLTASSLVNVVTGTWQVRASSSALTGSRIDAAWLAGAELVRLELEDLGTFTRPLHAEFTLKK
jgi:hypothetical protein